LFFALVVTYVVFRGVTRNIFLDIARVLLRLGHRFCSGLYKMVQNAVKRVNITEHCGDVGEILKDLEKKKEL
jgi:hypothetical protein